MLPSAIATYQSQVDEIASIAPLYDLAPPRGGKNKRDSRFPRSNGFRTFVGIAGSFVGLLTTKLSSLGAAKRIKGRDAKELNSLNRVLEALVKVNGYLLEMHQIAAGRSRDGGGGGGGGGGPVGPIGSIAFFPQLPEDLSDPRVADLSRRICNADLSCFYGRVCGFHYRGDCRALAGRFVAAVADRAERFDRGKQLFPRRLRLRLFRPGQRAAVDPDALGEEVFRRARELPAEFFRTCGAPEALLRSAAAAAEGVGSRRVDLDGVKASHEFTIAPERMTVLNTQGERRQGAGHE